MAISEVYAFSNTLGGTEHDLTSNNTTVQARTDDGVYQVFVDFGNLAAGDLYELKVYEQVRSADSQKVVYSVRFANAQTEPIWVSPSLILIHGWTVTIIKVSGSDRAVFWSIRQIA